MTIKPENIKKLLSYVVNSKEPPSTKEIGDSLGLEKTIFDRTIHFCEENHLIKYIERALDKDKPTRLTNCVEIKDRGVNYLIYEHNLEIERRHSNIVKWATIVIAIATAINVFVAYLNYIK